MEDLTQEEQTSICSNRSESVYEKNRRKKLEESSIKNINLVTAILLTLSGLLAIATLQYQEYLYVISPMSELHASDTDVICKQIRFANIDIVSSMISFLITIVFVVVSKRSSFLRGYFRVIFEYSYSPFVRFRTTVLVCPSVRP
jgi:hypothetical protein